MSDKPTPAQEAAIRYFDNPAAYAGKTVARMTSATYRACRDRGWLESSDEWPYHRTTDTGRRAIGYTLDAKTGKLLDEALGAEPTINGRTLVASLEYHAGRHALVRTNMIPTNHLAPLRVPETGTAGGIGRLLCGRLLGGPLEATDLDRVDCLGCVDAYVAIVTGRTPDHGRPRPATRLAVIRP